MARWTIFLSFLCCLLGSVQGREQQNFIEQYPEFISYRHLVTQGKRLELQDYEKVARTLLEVQRSMSDEFPIADGITLSMYILFVLAQVGEYDLTGAELEEIIAFFNKLTGIELPDRVMEIIGKISVLRFAKRAGLPSVQIITRDPEGIRLPLEDERDFVVIPNRMQLAFKELTSSRDHQEFIDFLNTPFKLPFLPDSWFESLNQIDPQIPRRIAPYLREEKYTSPLKIVVGGAWARIRTESILGTLDLEFQDAYTTPGIRDAHERALPSFHIWASSRWVNIKTSLAY